MLYIKTYMVNERGHSQISNGKMGSCEKSTKLQRKWQKLCIVSGEKNFASQNMLKENRETKE